MIRTLLSWFGWEIVYVCSWGTYSRRYCMDDVNMNRPIHKDMSVAPPWAKRVIRLKAGGCLE